MGRQQGGEGLPERSEVGRVVGETDIEGAFQRLQLHGVQAVGRRIEILRHAAGVGQFAGELIGPTMIGADEAGGGSCARLADARAAMAAGVVEGMQRARPVAGDHHGPWPDVEGHVAAGPGQLHLESHQEPGAGEDGVEVEVIGCGVVVEPLRQAVAGLSALQQRLDHRGVGGSSGSHAGKMPRIVRSRTSEISARARAPRNAL